MNIWKVLSTVATIGGALLAIAGGIASDKLQKIEIEKAVKEATNK